MIGRRRRFVFLAVRDMLCMSAGLGWGRNESGEKSARGLDPAFRNPFPCHHSSTLGCALAVRRFTERESFPSNLPRFPSLMECLRFHKSPMLHCSLWSSPGTKRSPFGSSPKSLMAKNVSNTGGVSLRILWASSWGMFSREWQHIRPTALTRHFSKTIKEHIELLSSANPDHAWYRRGSVTSQGWPL